MINNFLVFVFNLMLFSCLNEQSSSNKQVHVVERVSAMLIEPGYYIGENDSIFNFMNHKYLIKTREFFDNDEIISHVAILKSEGYLEFSKAEFSKLKNFLDGHGFSEAIEANIVDKRHLDVNKKRFLIRGVDRNRRRIYYTSSINKDTLYCLVYR